MKTTFLASTALLATCLFAGSAQANVVATWNPDSLPPPGDYSLDCGGMGVTCQGFTATNTLSATQARAYDLGSSDEATELAFLNTLLGGGGVTSAYKPGTVGPTASTNKEYFSIKIGQQTTFYKNMTTGTLDLRFLKGTASQAFSHLTEYGDPVPLPGAVWLFGSAMVGLVALNRRRKMAG